MTFLKRLVLTCRYSVAWVCTSLITATALSSDPDSQTLDQEFRLRIQPLLTRYCDSCHSGPSPEAKLDTSDYRDSRTVSLAWDSWQSMVSRVTEQEMPPADSAPLPNEIERALIVDWTRRFRREQAEQHRGDPGPVGTRRLSNAEFNYTIRELTGVDIEPTKSFPVDPANAAGFDNSAESLTISPSLISKYLDAARQVADHLLLTPDGIRFAPHPVVTDTDRDKYCVQRIVNFYQKQPTQIRDYLLACWRLRHVDQSLDQIAVEYSLSPKYLVTVWEALHAAEPAFGPLASIRQRWESLPSDEAQVDKVYAECADIEQWIQLQRTKLVPPIANLKGPGVSDGSQSLVLWKNRRMAANRRVCREDGFSEDNIDSLTDEDRARFRDADETARKSIVASYQMFCSTFPDAFYIAERGRSHIDVKDANKEAKGRLLSAGFHSMMGYFRDDQPLYDLLLSSKQQSELDRLWEELNFITLAPMRQYSGFIWYERAESSFINEDVFNFIRAEDRSARSAEMIERFANLYLEKANRRNGSPAVVEAIEFYFADMNRQIRKLESDLQHAQPLHLDALVDFAQRAYRRPITTDERTDLEKFYRHAIAQPNADHRSAIEDTLISVLVSPSQLFRWDLQCSSPQPQLLSDVELASRLSYFLWGCNPDSELTQRAASNQLSNPNALRTEMHRMLADER